MWEIVISQTVWTIVGAIATVVATIVAIVQLIRFKHLDRQFDDYRRLNHNRIWGHIQIVLEAYETLEDARQTGANCRSKLEYVNNNEFLKNKISSARKALVATYLRLLEHAISEEPDFDEEMAENWKSQGKLENDWRYQKALRFVRRK